MMAALLSWAQAYPVIATILLVALLTTSVLLVWVAWWVRTLPSDTLGEIGGEIEAPITSINELDRGIRPTAPQPLPWTRGGGNWWPIP